jgi:hypothetical protein
MKVYSGFAIARALKKAKSRWEGFNNPPKSPFRKGGLKRISLNYHGDSL